MSIFRRVSRKASQAFGFNPSDNPPEASGDATASIAPNPSLDEIPTNILAFRTITKLLALIQQGRAFQVSEVKLQAPQRKQLKIMNALSNVAVMDHEVVAVVTSFDSGMFDLNSNTLDLIACVEPSNEKPPIAPSKSSFSNRMWDVVYTQNFRHDDPKTDSTRQLAITDAKVLAGLSLDSDEAIKVYADEYWSGQTIATHLWIVGKLLSMTEPTTGKRDFTLLSNRLIHHVIANCFPKIGRRLTQPASVLFIDSLKSMTAWDFDEAKRGKPTPANIQNDLEFVVNYLLTPKEDALDGKIPNLIKQAELVRDKKEEWLYTKETCIEFHAVLVSLINDFTASLVALQHIDRKGKPTKGNKEFRFHVARTIVSGYMLQRLAKGAALKMHLDNISPLLKRYHLQTSMSTQQPEECDEDIEAVRASLRKGEPLATAYLDWFRLLVVHFDAVDILAAYVAGKSFPFKDISISLMVPPHLTQELLPWRDLFVESTLPTPADTIPDVPKATNDDILVFLNEALQTLPQFGKARAAWNKRGMEATKTCLEVLKTSNVKSWKKCATRVLDMLAVDNLSDDAVKEITTEIETAYKSTLFFSALNKTSNSNFKGSLHCEAALASLLTEASLASKDILARMKGFGRTMGVSKCCCPTCGHLLRLLGANGGPFIVRGSHHTVSACTLPTWLPKETVDSMNQAFGSQLRRELVDLIHCPELLRNRSQSIGSERLSIDSTEQPNFHLPISNVDFEQGGYVKI